MAQITGEADISRVARSIQRESRRIFSPRLVVLKVDSPVWRQTVLHLTSIAAATVIDVSEPSENLLWEIAELTGDPRARCLFVGNYGRVRGLGAQAGDTWSPESLAGRLATLIDGVEILAYTTDRAGVARFSRSMRAMLLTRSHTDRPARSAGARPLPQRR